MIASKNEEDDNPESTMSGTSACRSIFYEVQKENGHETSPDGEFSKELTAGGKEPRPAVAAPLSSSKPRSVYRTLVGIVLLEVPLLTILLIYSGVVWFGHVQDTYLIPQYHALKFSRHRAIQDNTYYTRVCDAEDMTTRTGADLFLPKTATPEQAYHHQLKHGFTVFRNILDAETANNLREYVVSKNRNLREDELIYVIEGNHRYSFGLGTEIPSVAKAVKQLATNMGRALEKILGPDPALIEMTAITSAYGAVSQWWHDDVIPDGSPVQFGRAFGPSYSVFIQLQNTTASMGATAACPGTLYCASGTMEIFCEEEGFQLTSESGFWHQGDALLMNMNSWHRGGAHTEKDGLDRVMLILTFVPKPKDRAETRQMSQGITFSLRWDMWGHTLRDLANAEKFMTQPWATLRALGLYKPKDAVWGIDYITSASMRAANNDNGFREDELETLLNKGGFWFLPRWLQFYNIDWDAGDCWPQFISGTQKLCEKFFLNASRMAVALYLFVKLVSSVIQKKGVSRPVVQLVLLLSMVYSLYQWAKAHVDETGWAKDIRGGRRYVSTNKYDRAVYHTFDMPVGPSTYPTKYDVLFENRYGSKELAMYNDFIPLGHPGNRMYNNLIEQKGHPAISDYGLNLQNAVAESIRDEIYANKGRFLVQGPDGFWMWPRSILPIIRKELLLESKSSIVRVLDQTARYIVSDYKYGMFRDSALGFKHSIPYINAIRTYMIDGRAKKPNEVVDGKPKAVPLTKTTLHIGKKVTLSASSPIETGSSPEPVYEAPFVGAWIKEGDMVEVYDGDSYWYSCWVQFVTAKGRYYVKYADEEVETFDQYSIRPFTTNYYIGEKLECWVPEQEEYVDCTLNDYFSDDTYSAITEDGKIVRQLKRDALRRKGQRIRRKYNFKGGYH